MKPYLKDEYPDYGVEMFLPQADGTVVVCDSGLEIIACNIEAAKELAKVFCANPSAFEPITAFARANPDKYR